MSKATTRDIAKLAGVSQSTVSIALRETGKITLPPETRLKVLSAAEQLGYERRPLSSRFPKTHLIGLMLPTLSNFYYASLAQNLQIYAKSKKISIVITNTLRGGSEYEDQALKTLRRYHVDGILFAFVPKAAVPVDVPAVIVSEKNPEVLTDTISLNSYRAGFMMAGHIASLGHKNIAYISTPLTNITFSRRNRMEGIRAKLAELGCEKGLVTLIDNSEESEALDETYEFACGRRMAAKLLRSGKEVSAVIAVNDMTAAGVVSMLHERNIPIPERMAVCGFDNLLISRIMDPSLTTMDQGAFHGCKLGLDILIDKVENAGVHEYSYKVEYEPRLIIRASTQRGNGNHLEVVSGEGE
jgi:LacI family transcriptional regulator